MYTFEFVNGVLTIFKDGVAIQDQPFDPNTQEPWADEAAAQAYAVAQIKAMQGTVSRKVTPLAFMSRFTLQEHAAVLTAAQSNMLVRAVYDRLNLAKNFVDLEDPAVHDGLMLYFSESLITEERMNAILSAPVTAKEMP
jgi:hypothetical protein